MDSDFQALPPLKRYRLLQQQELQKQQQTQNTLLHTPKPNTPSPSRLPAKKRKQSLSPPSPPQHSSYSLPAKKRVWAIKPHFFDLNEEWKPPSPNKKPEENKIETAQQSQEKDANAEEEDDGILCAVCQSTDGDKSDPIVFCDGCDLMVHATCYGKPLIDEIPEGDWFCAQCLGSESHTCCLCPNKGGAMKPTKDGTWAHLVCAMFVPEVFFEDSEGREGIDCSKVPKMRWGNRCYVCKSKKGCGVECSEPNCGLWFHVTCGLKEDLWIDYRQGKKGAVVAGFCKVHTDLWNKVYTYILTLLTLN